MGTSDRRQAWTRYWQSGALHSCMGSYDGNYGGAVAAFWRARFAALTPAMRVLDLGTGNGPLPALMLEALGADAMPAVDAVDFATPAPAWRADRVRFHPEVRIEALPFADASADRVYSQFGFEYADRTKALDEVIRVLAPDGEIALVCHHARSRLVEVAIAEVEHTDWLLGAGGVPQKIRALLPHAASGNPATRERFNSALAALAERARDAAIPDALHDAGRACAQLVQLTAERGPLAGENAVDAWIAQLRDARLRSDELRAHALDDEAAAHLVDRLRDHGLEADRDELHEGPYLVGWTFTGRS